MRVHGGSDGSDSGAEHGDGNAQRHRLPGQAVVDWSAATINQIDEEVVVTDDWGTPLDDTDDRSWTVNVLTDGVPYFINYEREFTVDDFPFCGTWDITNWASFITNELFETGADFWTITFVIPCDEGCTPGFWQNPNNGAMLWDAPSDPIAAELSTYFGMPFQTDVLFGSLFSISALPPEYATKTLQNLVKEGAGPLWAQKASRSLVASLLNAADGEIGYPASLDDIMDDWAAAVDAYLLDGDLAFKTFQETYGSFNELGCDRTPDTSSAAIYILPLAALASCSRLWSKGRHRA